MGSKTVIRRQPSKYLYLDLSGNQRGTLEDSRLADCDDRHRIELEPSALRNGRFDPFECIASELDEGAGGVVLALHWGIPSTPHHKVARHLLRRGHKLWFWWPRERTVEAIDSERLRSLRRHWWANRSVRVARKGVRAARRPWQKARRVLARVRGKAIAPSPSGATATSGQPQIGWRTAVAARLDAALRAACPIPLRTDPGASKPGAGVYLRTDFWAPISGGGSYGHTCYVAKWLAETSGGVTCFMPHRYDLLDEMGLRQVVVDAPFDEWHEEHIAQATEPVFDRLKAALQALQPAYIYERTCLGNFAGALLSQALGIPYIVEYNGSEISMKRSFAGDGYEHEDLYLRAEQVAFLQATLITVVSEPIKEDLVGRGISAEKILVNPNGADLEAYAPLEGESRAALRKQLGYSESDRVIGFTGTFGGWHGIDVLAAALPEVCQRVPHARFLLIGDGNFRHLIDEAVARHELEDQVHLTGRVPQQEGARLLRACDVFVSPHNAHMVDSRFFGSPTKIFEYMALGQGIVSTDLEQIGQVLSPALRSPGLNGTTDIDDQRSILCTPGDVEAFTEATVYLAKQPEVSDALGRNARQAIRDVYGWDHHVSRVWRALHGEPVDQVDCLAPTRVLITVAAGATEVDDSESAPAQPHTVSLETGDGFKDETQRQWDQDPCGSHYVENSRPDTLNWYTEVETYRYGTYAPWMPEVMEFAKHADHDVLEIGAGLGTDLSQFARHGARVTDLDLSSGHLEHAKRNFALRKLDGRFVHHDAEELPFEDASFDVVYSNGVIHHTPNTQQVVNEIFRVLRPGGRAILMVYAENSLHYWRNLFYDLGIKKEELAEWSIGEIMSRSVEISEAGSTPLVKVYTGRRLRTLLRQFEDVKICKRQLLPTERPRWLRWCPTSVMEPLCGWNLVAKARKPSHG